MVSYVVHPDLAADIVEARPYQLQAVDDALAGSTLLVLPTAAGKTAVAWMTIVERLSKKGGWALVIAPTVALANQHLQSTIPVLAQTSEYNPLSLSGQNTADKRERIWKQSKLIFATPQVVRNDVRSGKLSLQDCSLLVVDEAHHCTGSHAMGEAAELYLSQSNNPLILATTASPSSRMDRVKEICSRLGVKKIHLRTPADSMVSQYLSGLDIREENVEVPDEIRDLVEPFRIWQDSIVDMERRTGRYVMPGRITQMGLSNAMDRAQAAIGRGDKSGYRSSSQIATAMRLHHLINHLLCQGIAASRHFLKRMEEDSGKTRSSSDFLRDSRVRYLSNKLSEMDEIHSKVGAVRRLVRGRIRRDPGSRVIVFAHFRDTVDALEIALKDLEGALAIQFIGQSSRGESGGLTAKEQISRLEAFRSGAANVLVATSVGEEGLDIPSADLVIFYEPVSSEIRTIQRRGRTGRSREGEVVVLVAEGTRDEGAREASKRKEEAMHRAVRRVSRSLTGNPHKDLSNLSSFSVESAEGLLSASEFVLEARSKLGPEISEHDLTGFPDISVGDLERIPPESFRPAGQTGLDQF